MVRGTQTEKPSEKTADGGCWCCDGNADIGSTPQEEMRDLMLVLALLLVEEFLQAEEPALQLGVYVFLQAEKPVVHGAF